MRESVIAIILGHSNQDFSKSIPPYFGNGAFLMDE
jgi:hypothetical protein